MLGAKMRIVESPKERASKAFIDLSEKKVLVFDMGLFPEMAASLKNNRNGFGTVWYYTPWQSDFPSAIMQNIGRDFKGLTRIQEFFEYVPKADVIVFFDTYCGDLATFLRKQGYSVWGAGEAEEMEIDRWKMRTMQKELGLNTQQTSLITSVDDLEIYFQGIKNKIKEEMGVSDEHSEKLLWDRISKKYDNFSEKYYFGESKRLKDEWMNGAKDKFVKFPLRGTQETFSAPDYDSSLSKFNSLSEQLAHRENAKEVQFLIEEKMKGSEPGWDGIQINGDPLSTTMYGFERKGSGYIGKILPYDELPEPMLDLNAAMLGLIKDKYTPSASFMSNEFILDDKRRTWLIDPCIRNPAPTGSAIFSEAYLNLPEIIWNGAHGFTTIPEMIDARYCAGVCFDSSWAEDHELEVEVDKGMEQWIKFRKAYEHEGKTFASKGFSSICSAIGFGDTPEEAIKQVKERANSVHAYSLDTSTSGLDNILNDDIPKFEEIMDDVF